MNLSVIIITILVVAFIIFLVLHKNKKDKKELEEKLKNDYDKSDDGNDDIQNESW